MKIKLIEEKLDKNQNPMKVITTEDDTKVFVNSKYNKEVFDVLTKDSDVEVVKEGDFWKVKPESVGVKEAPKGRGMSAGIREAQNNKADQISKAQDRTAMLWAKVNASTLVAHHPAYKELTAEQVEEKISQLASKILNDELLPF